MEQATCGRGLAERSRLQAKLGDVIASVADVLDRHMAALDSSDPNTEAERVAYVSLVGEHRGLASGLTSTAREMASYRDLPMARHDTDSMSSPVIVEAFERFVNAKQELLAVLLEETEQDRLMLLEMQNTSTAQR